MSRLGDLIDQDTKQKNETKNMTVLIRKLILLFFGLSVFGIILNAGIMHTYYGAAIWFGMLLVDALTLYISYSASKKVLLTIFVFQKCIWIFASIMVFGWEGGYQFFLILLMIIYSFGEAGYTRKKLVFNFACFILFVIFLLFFKGNEGKISIEGMERTIQIFNTLMFSMMTAMVVSSFSKESQGLDEKLVKYNKQLEFEASVDALTGLNNRRSTLEYIRSLIEGNKTFSICMCDIDHFKKLNDNYGHDIGDDMLVAISIVFRKMTGSDAFVSRWGGEEFLLIFPDMNGDMAYGRVYEISKEVKKISLPCGEDNLSVTMTFGLSEFDLARTIDENIKEADEKLYIGKENGRDKIVY